MPVHNEEIAAAFDEFADLLSLQDANPFRVRAYRRAALMVRGLPGELYESVAGGLDPDSLPGIGADLASKIREFLGTGRLRALEILRRDVPPGLRALLALPGLGPKRVRLLHRSLGVRGLEDLRKAIAGQQLARTRGLGKALEDRLARTLAQAATPDGAPAANRILRAGALRRASSVCRHLRSVHGIDRVEVAGSLRRGCETVGDLDVVAMAARPLDLGAALRAFDETERIVEEGPTRVTAVLRGGLQLDVRVVAPASFGAAWYYFTGSKAHNIHVRRMAREKGLKINEYGVFRGAQRVAGDTEESVARAVGLPWMPPELREDRGEIEAALRGALPRVVDRTDLRGDLHAHTRASDGTTSIAALAEGARREKLQYLAITDHGRHLGIVHGLDADALARQGEEIDAFNARSPAVTLLKGVEVDILEDGRLALPDAALASLDVVVIACHTHLQLSRRAQTTRLRRALDRPCVSILAHPTARLIGERPPIEADWPIILRQAAARPCYLELNCQPARLDLDDLMVRAAAQAGVLLSIASDAHGPGDFASLTQGVVQARRGWLTTERVLNCRPLPELRAALAKTRT